MKYNPDKTPGLVRELILKGFSNKKICVILGISEETFYHWKRNKSEFSEMVAGGKQIISDILDEPLLKLAFGYQYTETLKNYDEDHTLISLKKISKNVPPSLAAIKYYKNNIDPKQWRDRK